MTKKGAYFYDDHTEKLFKIVNLKPATDRDENVTAHRHNYFEIFIFRDGGGEHLIDFEEFQVNSHCVHFVPPGSVHLLRRNENTKGYVLLLSRDIISLMGNQKFYLSQKPSKPVVELLPQEFQKLAFHIELIQEELAAQTTYSSDIITNYLNIILFNFQRKFKAKENEFQPNKEQNADIFQKFQLMLEKEFFMYHQVNDYAKKLHILPNLLNQICKNYLGKTAASCIQERLLLEAKRMLFHSDMTSKEIAYALNFNDPAYFGRFFKRKTQQSPQVFRQKIREKYHVLS